MHTREIIPRGGSLPVGETKGKEENAVSWKKKKKEQEMRIAGKEKGGVDYSCCFFFLCARIRGRDFVPRGGGRKLLLGKFVEKFGGQSKGGRKNFTDW